MTPALSVDCYRCSVPAGQPCTRGWFCQSRLNAAARLTRDSNRARRTADDWARFCSAWVRIAEVRAPHVWGLT